MKTGPRVPVSPRPCLSFCAVALLLVWSGCGAPGDPLPPLLNIPARTTDLEAVERGGELILSWTLPAVTTEGFPIKYLDRVVVLGREVEEEAPDPGTFEAGARELHAANQPLSEQHAAGERVEVRLPVAAAPGKRIALAVKNYDRRGRAGGLSNIVVLDIVPAPAAPRALTATPTPNAIRLEWPEVAGVSGYRIYRRTVEGPSFTLLVTVAGSPFDDSDFVWGARYSYFVRASVKTSSGAAESTDSPTVGVVPQDVFPPSPPADLRAVAGEFTVDISWNPSPEPDTAGYHVYRRGASGQPVRLNAEALAAPVFSDKDVRSGQQYSYTVSAVDEKGNESAPSQPIQVSVP